MDDDGKSLGCYTCPWFLLVSSASWVMALWAAYSLHHRGWARSLWNHDPKSAFLPWNLSCKAFYYNNGKVPHPWFVSCCFLCRVSFRRSPGVNTASISTLSDWTSPPWLLLPEVPAGTVFSTRLSLKPWHGFWWAAKFRRCLLSRVPSYTCSFAC